MCSAAGQSVQNLGCEPASFYARPLLPNELSRTDKGDSISAVSVNLNCVDIAEYLHISHEASRVALEPRQKNYAHLLAAG